jgi:hypothetical protein
MLLVVLYVYLCFVTHLVLTFPIDYQQEAQRQERE